MFGRVTIFPLLLAAIFTMAACSGASPENTANNANTTAQNSDSPKARPTPSNQITEADVAKLKWLEGTWRGMDGQKPFYERIRFDGMTMIVDTFADETVSKINDTARFELKDGEFGHTVGGNRSAASSITDDSVQFVPASAEAGTAPKGHTFRFERIPEGGWQAVLETTATAGRAATEKAYKMEPWKAPAK